MRALRFSFVCDALQVLGPIRLAAVVIERGGPLNAFHVFLRNRGIGRRALRRVERNCRARVRVRLEFLGLRRVGFGTLRPGHRGLGACRLRRVVRASLDRSRGFGRPWRQYWVPVCLLALFRHNFLRVVPAIAAMSAFCPRRRPSLFREPERGRQGAQIGGLQNSEKWQFTSTGGHSSFSGYLCNNSYARSKHGSDVESHGGQVVSYREEYDEFDAEITL